MTAEQVKKWLIPRLVSGNLAIWTVLALEKVILYCFWVPREINLRFCSKTQWPDVSVGFRPLCWCPSGWASTWRGIYMTAELVYVGAHPAGHQHSSRKPTETSGHWVLLQKRKFISRGTQKRYNITFSNARTVQIAKFPEISLGISTERFLFLFWSILNGVTLKTSNYG